MRLHLVALLAVSGACSAPSGHSTLDTRSDLGAVADREPGDVSGPERPSTPDEWADARVLSVPDASSSPPDASPDAPPVPAPTLLAAPPAGTGGAAQPYGIAVSGGNVYFSDLVNGDLYDVPSAGGKARLIASGLPMPWGVAADTSYVYWSNYGSPAAYGSIMKAAISSTGGTVTPLFMATLVQPMDIAINTTTLYAVTASGTPEMVALAGGPASPFLAGMPGSPQLITTVAANDSFFCAGYGQPGSLYLGVQCYTAATSSFGYATNWAANAVYGYGPMGRIALDGVNLYTTTTYASAGGVVTDWPLASGGLGGYPPAIASGLDSPGPIVSDGTSVYWLDKDALRKVAIGGGTPVTLAAPAGYVPGQSHLALDASTAYWTTASAVMKASK